MTGIERLREFVVGISPDIAVCGVTKTSYDREHKEEVWARLRDFLSDIAGQIERETKPKSDAVKYASVSAYDPPSQEDRDAIAWVREHGGLDAVKRRWDCLSYYADPVPRSCMEKRLARLQRQIDESHAALRRRNERIKELNRRACDLTRKNAELRKRAMPEGMCWPVFEDGEPVRVGDVVSDVEVRSVVFRDGGILLSDCTSVPGWGTWRSYKEPIKRPAPKVLDADGVEIRVGDTVYHVKDGSEMTVYGIEGEWLVVSVGSRARHDTVTHRAPVLAADGRPLEVGQTVYAKNYAYVKCTVLAIEWVVDGYLVEVENEGGHKFRQTPDEFTHERPDSWQRIEEDAEKDPCGYFGFDGEETCGKCPASGKNCEQTMAQDLVRRCRALAGVDK